MTTPTTPAIRPLTPKQALFVAEYPKDFNATQAAIRAGYSAKTAGRIAAKLVVKSCIVAALADAQAERIERTEVTVDYLVDNAREVLERCMERAPVMVRDPDERGRMVQLVDDDGRNVWQFDARGALGALTLLSKHTGGFSDKVEHSGPNGGAMVIAVTRRLHHVQPAK